MDDMKQYRTVCASRINRLERFKKTRSFCSLDQETSHGDSAYASSNERDCHLHPSSSSASSDNDDDVVAQDTFEMIKEKMISLMEDDVSLLQQLMALSDKINEVKKGRGLLPRSLSQTSLSDGFDREADEEEDFFDDDVPSSGFAASASAVTTLYLNEDEPTSSTVKPNPPQFFSRKNSVLRIPIAPRMSNRINRRPSDMSLRHARPLHIDAAAAAAAPAASPAASTITTTSSFTRPSPVLSSTTSSASSTVSSASGAKILQRSSASSDSGRASSGSSCGSPSPTF